MKRFMWSFLALLIVACVGVYLAGGFECFAASPGTAGAAIPGDRTKAYITLGILIVAALLFVTEALPLPITAMLVPVGHSGFDIKIKFINNLRIVQFHFSEFFFLFFFLFL